MMFTKNLIYRIGTMALLMALMLPTHAQQIYNSSDKTIFWRAFKTTDHSFAVGLAEGTIASGETGLIDISGYTEVKLEIKNGKSVFDPNLVKAGNNTFNFDQDYEFDGKRLLIAQVYIDENSKTTEAWTEYALVCIDRVSNAATTDNHESVSRKKVKSWAYKKYNSSLKNTSSELILSADGEVEGSYKMVKGRVSVSMNHKIKEDLSEKSEVTFEESLIEEETEAFMIEEGYYHVTGYTFGIYAVTCTGSYMGEEIEYTYIDHVKIQEVFSKYNSKAEVNENYINECTMPDEVIMVSR